MFTGIVEDVGVVRGVWKKDKDALIKIGVGEIDSEEISLGESVAVNGVCLTVISVGDGEFSVEASHETLSRTNLSNLLPQAPVNLERSVRVGDRMGGHIVTGHVDGIGTVESIVPVGESLVFSFSLPDALARYLVEKGSVAVDGVSLTVNSAEGSEFSVNIIPHTLEKTIFSELRKGSQVNIECDIIAKHVEKMLFSKGVREK